MHWRAEYFNSLLRVDRYFVRIIVWRLRGGNASVYAHPHPNTTTVHHLDRGHLLNPCAIPDKPVSVPADEVFGLCKH